ncbi:MAG: DUF1207 domain-containing protein [Ignavibacteriales bacterium]|nr:MAG: DUF1207 domain-containing protein [Ignavibacteriales bacterium]
MIKILAGFVLLFAGFFNWTLSQNTTTYFPQGVTFKPLYSNLLEARAGSSFMLGENRLRLDIGTTADFLRIDYPGGEKFSFGGDFFTWTRLRKNDDFKFPVMAVDYLFGLNASYNFKLSGYDAGIRFRFSHISAHLVDGQFDDKTLVWRDGQLPFVYSREFIEIFPAVYFNKSFRVYGGVTYIFHTIPEEVKPFILQTGAEKYFDGLLSESVTPFVYYGFELAGNESYTGHNSITAGIKMGNAHGGGISFYYNYLSGKSVHGMFFNTAESYSSVGFNVDL